MAAGILIKSDSRGGEEILGIFMFYYYSSFWSMRSACTTGGVAHIGWKNIVATKIIPFFLEYYYHDPEYNCHDLQYNHHDLENKRHDLFSCPCFSWTST